MLPGLVDRMVAAVADRKWLPSDRVLPMVLDSVGKVVVEPNRV